MCAEAFLTTVLHQEDGNGEESGSPRKCRLTVADAVATGAPFPGRDRATGDEIVPTLLVKLYQSGESQYQRRWEQGGFSKVQEGA
jgi:hypothetical protein